MLLAPNARAMRLMLHVCDQYATEYSEVVNACKSISVLLHHVTNSRWPNLEPLLYIGAVHAFGNTVLSILRVYTVFRKKHPLTFSFISPWMMCGFEQKLQWIYPRNGRFWQCKIRYSLRPMTSLWRCFCLAKVGASLQHAISHKPRMSFLCEYRVLVGA